MKLYSLLLVLPLCDMNIPNEREENYGNFIVVVQEEQKVLETNVYERRNWERERK